MAQLRHEIAYSECTRDPVFLLQTREYVYLHDKYKDHGVEYSDDDEGPIDLETRERLSGKDLENRELAVGYWITQSVWYSREEAEDFGQRKSYDYGTKNVDWQVYCLCAEGELAKILDQHDNCRPPRKTQPQNTVQP